MKLSAFELVGIGAILSVAFIYNYKIRGHMKTSLLGASHIKKREALRLKVYRDQGGLRTIGWGHLMLPHEKFETISERVADDIFARDLHEAENIVNSHVSVKLTQGQFDGLVSMAFNLGARLFVNSDGSQTRVYRAILKGDFRKAADSMLLFNKVRINGALTVSAGLTARRAHDQQIFLS